jgi:hypothetical protein
LSAHDQAKVPPDSRYESINSTTEPYVPATMMKHPKTIRLTLQMNPVLQLHVFRFLPFQLSYNHIMPIGWYDIRGTSRPPMSDTRPPKMGTALATMYDMMVMAATLPNQVIQWVGVDVVRCFEFRSIRTNSSLAGNWKSIKRRW